MSVARQREWRFLSHDPHKMCKMLEEDNDNVSNLFQQ